MLCDSPLCRDGIVVIKFTKSRKLSRHRFCIPQDAPVPASRMVVVDGTAVVAATSPGGGFAVIERVGPGGEHTMIL